MPNGSAITPNGKTLIVAETTTARLTAFDIEPDGSLARRRVWAHLDERVSPHGICLDAEGAVWVASSGEIRGVLRVREGGEVTHRVEISTFPAACTLGGPQRRPLFLLTAQSALPDEARANEGACRIRPGRGPRRGSAVDAQGAAVNTSRVVDSARPAGCSGGWRCGSGRGPLDETSALGV